MAELDASDEEIMEAARRARLDEMIAGLPAGLDTVVGERGVKLRAGRSSALAIARIFLKNPPILILDEATSALDTATEAAIQQALERTVVGPHHADHRASPGDHSPCPSYHRSYRERHCRAGRA